MTNGPFRDIAEPSHGTAESEILEVRESKSRPDRGIVYMESRGINQNGDQVLTLRRRFLVPKRGAAVK